MEDKRHVIVCEVHVIVCEVHVHVRLWVCLQNECEQVGTSSAVHVSFDGSCCFGVTMSVYTPNSPTPLAVHTYTHM